MWKLQEHRNMRHAWYKISIWTWKACMFVVLLSQLVRFAQSAATLEQYLSQYKLWQQKLACSFWFACVRSQFAGNLNPRSCQEQASSSSSNGYEGRMVSADLGRWVNLGTAAEMLPSKMAKRQNCNVFTSRCHGIAQSSYRRIDCKLWCSSGSDPMPVTHHQVLCFNRRPRSDKLRETKIRR